jgi:hypothetical protein
MKGILKNDHAGKDSKNVIVIINLVLYMKMTTRKRFGLIKYLKSKENGKREDERKDNKIETKNR